MSLVFGVLVVFVGFCCIWVGVIFVFGWFGRYGLRGLGG